MKTAFAVGVSIVLAGGTIYWIASSGEGEGAAMQRDARDSKAGKSTRSGPGGSGTGSGSTSQATRRGSTGGGTELAMEHRVERLEQRVKQLEAQLRVTRASSGGSAALDLNDPESSAQIHEVVEGALEDARQAEIERRNDRRLERMKSSREEGLAALVAKGAFTPEKTSEIAGLWKTEQDELASLMSEASEGEADFRALRQKARDIRTATDAAATAGMSEEQKAAYDENRPGGGPGGGRGGRGGGGGAG